MNIAVIGTGFVGVVSAAVYASFGNKVSGIDIDEKKVAALKKGLVPFYEPQLQDLLNQEQKSGRLTFTTQFSEGCSDADIILICVGTPSKATGEVDLQYVFSAADMLAPHLKKDAIVVVKSTVPPGTLDAVSERIQNHTATPFSVASVPEFLREGTAVHDTLHPDRVVIGSDDPAAVETLKKLHEPLEAPIVVVKPESAQMAKYAANAYLATRITFINHIADLCEHTSADVEEVIEGIGLDARIGSHYWYPGLGYGGSCFPKDVNELAHFSETVHEAPNIFTALRDWNDDRIPEKIKDFGHFVDGWKNKKIAVLGLSFKPNTNDMRVAPSLHVIPSLLEQGATVVGYDPKAVAEAQHILKSHPELKLTQSLQEACTGADVIMVLIEWPEIVNHDYSLYAKDSTQYFIDTRNQFSQNQVEKWGFVYRGIGRHGE